MVILDCNAAVAIVRGTPEGEAFRALMLEGEEVRAPDFIHIELANVIWQLVRAGQVEESEVDTLLFKGLSIVDVMEPSGELVYEALSESIRLNHPVYDLLYFVLARRSHGTVFTLDKRLADLCAQNGVNVVQQVKV